MKSYKLHSDSVKPVAKQPKNFNNRIAEFLTIDTIEPAKIAHMDHANYEGHITLYYM